MRNGQPLSHLGHVYPGTDMYTVAAIKRMKPVRILGRIRIGHIRIIWYNTSKWQLAKWDVMLSRLRLRWV